MPDDTFAAKGTIIVSHTPRPGPFGPGIDVCRRPYDSDAVAFSDISFSGREPQDTFTRGAGSDMMTSEILRSWRSLEDSNPEPAD